jgi:LuxR family transcriptional regulator, maltose regulon positive regulatory protein
MLRRHLQRSNSVIVPELHHRAAIWFEANEWVGEAIEHAFLAQNSQRAAQLVEDHCERIWRRGEVATLLRWLEALPEEALVARPKLSLNYAFMLTLTDAYLDAENRVSKVEQVLSQDKQFDEHERTAMLGQAAAVRATVSHLLGRDGNLTIAAGHQAIAQLPKSEVQWRGWVTMVMGVTYWTSNGEMTESERCLEEAIRLGKAANDLFTVTIALTQSSRMNMIRGRLQQAEATAHQLLRCAVDPGWVGQAHLDLSRIRYERNDLDGALDDVNTAWPMIQGHSLKRISMEGCHILARLKYATGHLAEAQDLMQQAVEMAVEGNLRDALGNMLAQRAWLFLTNGDLAAAAAWAEKIEPVPNNILPFARELEHMILARVQIAQGRLDEAQELLERLGIAASKADRMGRVIGIYVLQAIVARLQGNTNEALKSLAYALSLGEPEGYVRTFVDAGEPIIELLQEAQRRSIAPEYVIKLLAAFGGKLPSIFKPPAQQWIGDDIEPLSERELQVLQLIANGASNREIAEQLVVSLGTVKKHLNNIFLKLNASSRTQAIATARQHNLV